MSRLEGTQQWRECQEEECGKIFESTQNLCPGCNSENHSPFELNHEILTKTPEILRRIRTTDVSMFTSYL